MSFKVGKAILRSFAAPFKLVLPSFSRFQMSTSLSQDLKLVRILKSSWLNPKQSLGLIVVALALGCAGENEFSSVPPQIRFGSPKFSCLKNADETFGSYLEGRLPNHDVEEFWNCIDVAVVQFVKYVRGGDGQNYTPVEIAKFLDDFFLENRGLQNEKDFLVELMELKKLFVGGSTSVVSHQDLWKKTRAAITTFKSITLDLNPHMKTIYSGISGGKEISSADPTAVNSAVVALRTAAVRVGSLILQEKNFYSFTHLQSLIFQIEKFIRKSDPTFTFDNIHKYLPLFAEFKGLLVAPPYDLIRNTEWKLLFDSLGKVLGWGIQYRFNVEAKGWDQGEPLNELRTILHGVLDELESGIQRQEEKIFSYIDLDRLIEKLIERDMLPIDLDPPTARDTLRKIGQRILVKNNNSNDGLNSEDMAALRLEIDRWLDAQVYISQKANPSSETLQGGAAEMAMLMNSPWPLLRDQKGRMEFSQKSFGGQYDRASLTALNWQRAIIRAIMRAYTRQEGADGARGLSESELVQVASDWRMLAERLGLFEPGEAEKKAKKIFMEANLFMPSANGNDKIDFIEATQYLSYGISGLNGSAEIKSKLIVKCQDPKAPNQFLPTCLRHELFANKEDLLGNFPLLNGSLSSEAQWQEFADYLEITTRDKVSNQSFSRGDVVELLVLMHYIETYFALYDDNKNGLINVDETLGSFDVFNRSLDEIVKKGYGIDLGHDDLVALFTYLFKHGKPPQSNFGGMIKFLAWRWKPSSWSYDVNRIRVISILAELNSRR